MANVRTRDQEPDIRYIGCCGAYCRICRVLREDLCAGCTLGYGPGGREIDRARCAMKRCCFRNKGLETCADCLEYPVCDTIGGFQRKKGYKYRKYRQSLEYIRTNGYDRFLAAAAEWVGAYGRL